MTATSLTIGRLAREAGVNVETVRYYQRVGLIREPERPPVGYRVYPAATVDRLRFIRRAQQLGFSLREIAELLELGDGHCADVRSRAEQKLAAIERQISDLSALHDTLSRLVATCGPGRRAHCPIIESLASETRDPEQRDPETRELQAKNSAAKKPEAAT